MATWHGRFSSPGLVGRRAALLACRDVAGCAEAKGKDVPGVRVEPLTVGTESEAFELTVAPDRVRAYAYATGDENPLYFAGTHCPPMLGAVLGGTAIVGIYVDVFPDYPNAKIVHLGSDSRFFRPLVPGQRVIARARVVSMQRSPRGALVHIRSSLSGLEGESLVDTTETLLMPDVTEFAPGGEPPGESIVRSTRETAVRARRSVVVASDQATRYAVASGDFQPIHFDDAAARAAGLPRAALHGYCTMAICAIAVTDLVGGGDPERLARMQIRFSHPVFAGSVLTIEVFEPVRVDGRDSHAIRCRVDGHAAIRGGRAEVRA